MGVYNLMAYWINEVADHFQMQGMCNETVEVDPYVLRLVPDHLKTQEMCDKAVRDYLFSCSLSLIGL